MENSGDRPEGRPLQRVVMRVRAYRESDLEELRAIHAAQGFGYEFPELSNPLFLTKLVLVEDQEKSSGEVRRDEEIRQSKTTQDKAAQEETDPGSAAEHSCREGAQQCCAPTQRVVGAGLLRLTAEAYLLLDPGKGSPRERWQWLLAIHEATRREAWARGLEDVHAWLPPGIAAKFGKRLTRLGWVRDDVWTPYCKRLTEGG